MKRNYQNYFFSADGTEAPPDDVRCSAAIDVVFVLDSSSSIGNENFQLMKDYVDDVSFDIRRKAPY